MVGRHNKGIGGMCQAAEAAVWPSKRPAGRRVGVAKMRK